MMFLQATCDGGEPMILETLGRFINGLDKTHKEMIHPNLLSLLTRGCQHLKHFVNLLVYDPLLVSAHDEPLIRCMRLPNFVPAKNMHDALLLMRLLAIPDDTEMSVIKEVFRDVDHFLEENEWMKHLTNLIRENHLDRLNPAQFTVLLNRL